MIMSKGQESEGENVPEIESLTLRVGELSRSVDLWNLLMLWGLAGAMTAAAFVLLTTRIIVTRTGELTKAQDLLSSAKDRQLQSDLRLKDVEIGTLKVRSDTAEAEISKAQADAAKATQQAAAAKTAQQQVQIELAKQQTIAANAEKEL